jgi:hypothetical protein
VPYTYECRECGCVHWRGEACPRLRTSDSSDNSENKSNTINQQQFPLDFTPQSPPLRWLCEHLDGWQFGDQGLIEAIVNTLQSGGIAIEYGAGDGVELPLTIDRLYRAGRKCWLGEIEESRRESLERMYPAAIVDTSINWARVQHDVPSVAVVVIDIDSRDSVIMREMLDAGVRPDLLVVEHMDRHFPIGTTLPASIPQWMLGLTLQSGHAIQDTAETLHAIAGRYGYERIGLNRCNSFFVRGDKFLNLLR